jgi:anti-sigma factor (TIGR02949 family)
MRCDRVQDMLGAYRDGELSTDEHRAVSIHLDQCSACSKLLVADERIGQALKTRGRTDAPPALAERIRAELDKADSRSLAASPTGRFLPGESASRFRQFAQRAAVLVAGSLLSALATWQVMEGRSMTSQLERDIVSAHIRALLQDTPVQVASSDQHTVQPWFAGRIDFAPQVKDLAAAGFPLVGGRLDYVADRRVGTVVYKRRLHVINVFMWPDQGTVDSAAQATARNGFNLLSWNRNGVAYRAVSDLNLDEMHRLSRELW